MMSIKKEALKKSKKFTNNRSIDNRNENFEKQQFSRYYEDEALLKKLEIPFQDDDDGLTPSMSLMTLASALQESYYIDSTEDNINTRSSSYDNVDYSEYDFDDEYDEDDITFDFKINHEVMGNLPMVERKKYKNGTRSSLTFSNQRVEEIQRDNRILLDKIMRKGPSGEGFSKLKKLNQKPKIKSASEINRQKKQQQINYENLILKRKLDKIAGRNASLTNSTT